MKKPIVFGLFLLLLLVGCGNGNQSNTAIPPTHYATAPKILPSLGETLTQFTTQLHTTPTPGSNDTNDPHAFAYIYGPFNNNTIIAVFVDSTNTVVFLDISVADSNKQNLTLKQCQEMGVLDNRIKIITIKTTQDVTNHIETEIVVYQSPNFVKQFGNSLTITTTQFDKQTKKYNHSINVEHIKAGTVVEYIKRTNNRIIDCQWSVGPMVL